MGEKLEVYDLDGSLVGVQDRDEFYREIKDEFKDKGETTKKIRIVHILLLTSTGKVILQRRSDDKAENPGLYDKTVGGHVTAGYSWDISCVREAAEELGFPIAIVEKDEFLRAAKTTDLSVVGIFTMLDRDEDFRWVRKTADGDEFTLHTIRSFYLGYYDGAIRFVDGESSGIEVFTLARLEKEMEEMPEKFTPDIIEIYKKYKNHLIPL